MKTRPRRRPDQVRFSPRAIHALAILAALLFLRTSFSQSLTNGSFESGTSSWIMSDIPPFFIPLQVRPNGFSSGYGLFTSQATDGSYSAIHGFDGGGPGVIRIAQEVFITASAYVLTFDYRAGWDMLHYGPSSQARTFNVRVESSGGGSTLLTKQILTAAAATKNLDTGFSSGAVNLSAFIGQTVRICFDANIPESFTGPGLFELDNVRIGGAVPAGFSAISSGLPPLTASTVAWGDYDNDGQLDVIIAGQDTQGRIITRIYHNIGNGIFKDINAGLPGVIHGSVAWVDYDNDGYLDLVICGPTDPGGHTFFTGIYHNNTDGKFTRDTTADAALPQGANNSIAWGDYDNDGRLDILVASADPTGQPMTRIYHHNPNGTFTDIHTWLPGTTKAVAWGDYNGDGKLDVLIGGDKTAGPFLFWIFRNNGNGIFKEDPLAEGQPSTPDASTVTATWGDYDNDGRLDILVSGYSDWNGGPFTRIYRNNENGTFTDISAGLPGVYGGAVAWGDYNNDGWPDILISSWTSTDGSRLTGIYRNNKNGIFSRDTNADSALPQVIDGGVAWVDYNKDGRLDVLVSGSNYGDIYWNHFSTSNFPPSTPSGLAALASGTEVILSWSAAGDDHTPTAGLSYNVRVGTTPGGSNIVSPQSNPANGFRRVAQPGNAGQSLTKKLQMLSAGTYYWSVQSVDTAFAGSAFAAEGSFFIPPGSLQMTITPAAAASAGAQWQLDGGAWNNSGETVTNLTAGSHTVLFSPIPGWASPVTQTVTVNDAQTTAAAANYSAARYDTWMATYNLTGPDADPMADPDHDGMSNLLEYALGRSPTASNANATPASRTTVINQQTYLILAYRKPTADRRNDITYIVEATTDLPNPFAWSSNAVVIDSVTADGIGFETVVARFTTPVGNGLNSAFLRLRITEP